MVKICQATMDVGRQREEQNSAGRREVVLNLGTNCDVTHKQNGYRRTTLKGRAAAKISSRADTTKSPLDEFMIPPAQIAIAAANPRRLSTCFGHICIEPGNTAQPAELAMRHLSIC